MPGHGSDSPSPREIWRAGNLEVDVGQQRVRRNAEVLELPRLSFELLLALLRAAPNFVSNDELMTRVWRGLVVSPETVTQRVKLLRDALGDDPKQPRYIEGLRGRGYRMIPAVMADSGQPVSPPAAEVPVTHPTPAGSTPGLRRRSAGIAAAAAALLVALYLLLPWRGPGEEPPTSDSRTAAILRFEAAGDDDGQVMAGGLVDSITAQLSEVAGLQVIAHGSASRIDVQKLGTAAAGRLLGARYLVEGSLQQLGDKLRVTARLVDAPSGRVLWTRQFDRERREFFGLQDAVASGVVRALESRIAGLDPTIPFQERSRNVEAQFAYLRGRVLLGRTTVAGSEAAEREFARAMELDPTFVPAIVGRYDARLQSANLRRSDMTAAREQNEQLLQQAMRLQPDSGAVQLARAMWSGASREERLRLFEEGLKKDRSNARAMTAFSELLDQSESGRAEGYVWLQRALQIDPLWPRARFRAAQRNFPVVGSAVEQHTLKVLELDPLYYPALQRHAKYRWMMYGETAYAITVIERAIASDPDNPWGPHTAVAFYLDVNDPRAAEMLARSQPVVAASTAALRAQFAGDWRRAGEAAMAPGSFVFGKPERWGVATSLRDYGLRTGQTDRIIRLLADRYALPDEGDWALSTDNFREGQLLAHLLLASGRRSEGLRRLDEVLRWIDANAVMGPVFNLRTRAQALALKGETDAALAELDASFRQNDYTHWWYTLVHDPTWDALRNHPRFVAIATEVRAHVAAQADRLAVLRQDGQVPRRDTLPPAAGTAIPQ